MLFVIESITNNFSIPPYKKSKYSMYLLFLLSLSGQQINSLKSKKSFNLSKPAHNYV